VTDAGWRYVFRARLTRVIDGDTVVLAADLGLRVTHELVVRLRGCNAPEHGTPAGDAATDYTTKWLAGTAGPDGWLRLVTHADPGDKYGRWLADVTDQAGSKDLAAALIAAGHAVKWDGRGPKPVPPATA
jgi:micrococcal nuclease